MISVRLATLKMRLKPMSILDCSSCSRRLPHCLPLLSVPTIGTHAGPMVLSASHCCRARSSHGLRPLCIVEALATSQSNACKSSPPALLVAPSLGAGTTFRLKLPLPVGKRGVSAVSDDTSETCPRFSFVCWKSLVLCRIRLWRKG